MRIAVLSDIHGNLPALQAVMADLNSRGVDRVVNLGDCVSGPLLPAETAEFLMQQDWVHLAGNHERQLLTLPPERQGPSDRWAHARLAEPQLAWLASLSSCVQLTADVLLCHGTPTSDHGYFLETVEPDGVRAASIQEIEARCGPADCALILCGHTHVPRSLRLPDGQRIVNPGSVGLPAYADEHPFAHVIEMYSPDARYAIVEWREGAWTASLITVPYAHREMAELAQANQRPDWAHALMTGRMPQ